MLCAQLIDILTMTLLVHYFLHFFFPSISAVGKRQALESALKTVFFLLISQFEEFPWDIASLLYGVSVIDRHDLDVATSSFISASTRAEILAVTLVRHLRHFPDSFDDACKVLKHVSALQIANGTMQVLYYVVTCFRIALFLHSYCIDKLNLPALEESLNLMDTIGKFRKTNF